MSGYTYSQSCWLYAEDQGLDGAMDALDDHGIEWDLLQAGGFCMSILIDITNLHDRYIGSYSLVCDGDEWQLIWWADGFNADQVDDESDRILTFSRVEDLIAFLLGEATVDHSDLEQIDDEIQRLAAEQALYASHTYGKGVAW